ncbi:MAG: sensor domain-containing diguanylate cyclase [Pseudomonadota bacterium]
MSRTPAKQILVQLLSGVREPVLVVDVAAKDWRTKYFNPALVRLLGMSSGDITGQSGEKLMFRIAGTAGVNALRECDADHPQIDFDSQFMKSDAPDMHINGRVMSLQGNSSLRAVFLNEVPPQQASVPTSSGAFRTSINDTVTVFLNREPWLEVLNRDAAIAAREQAWLAVIVFRVEDFDSYVETFGQHAGDSALKRIAHSLRRRLKRSGDTAGRIADDEMAIVVHGSMAPAARQFANSIADDVRALAIHHPKSSSGRHLTVKPGVCALVPADGQDAQRMLQRARELLDTRASIAPVPASLTAH